MRSAWFAFPLLLLACKDPALTADQERVPRRKNTTSTETKPKATSASPRPTAPAKTNAIQWDDTIPWKSWEEGSRLAKASNKPIFLLVYADWCPHCRNLKPVFADTEIQKLASQMIMVHQDADDESASWLGAKVGAYGGYVPRIFFLSPEGTVKPEITSQNPKFPYFYTPEGIGMLKTSMRKVLGN